MILTNTHNLPAPLVRAVQRDPYNRGKADISVTQLIQPPRIVQLRARHDSEITVDVTERLWTLLGQAVHAVLERGVTKQDQEIAEERLYMDVNGWRVSGQADLWSPGPDGAGELDDYKFTSVWTTVHGIKTEWEAQLNCLAALYRNAGFPVERLYLTTVYRDWSRNQAKQGGNYPAVGAGRHVVEMWPPSVSIEYMQFRVGCHWGVSDLPDDFLPPCTPEERWQRPAAWAVIKKGNKRATRTFEKEDEAQTWAGEQKGKYQVVERPGTYARCEGYCDVAPFCNQWRAEQPREEAA